MLFVTWTYHRFNYHFGVLWLYSYYQFCCQLTIILVSVIIGLHSSAASLLTGATYPKQWVVLTQESFSLYDNEYDTEARDVVLCNSIIHIAFHADERWAGHLYLFLIYAGILCNHKKTTPKSIYMTLYCISSLCSSVITDVIFVHLIVMTHHLRW